LKPVIERLLGKPLAVRIEAGSGGRVRE